MFPVADALNFTLNGLSAVPYGHYLAWWKALPFLLVFFAWAKALDWSDKDLVAAHMPRDAINGSNLAGLAIAAGLFFALPNFFLATGVFILAFAVEVGVYLKLRNDKVGLADLKRDFGEYVKNFGKGKAKLAEAAAGVVQVFDKKGQPIAPPLSDDPIRPDYDAAQRVLDGPLMMRAERIDLARRDGAATESFTVDGVSHPGPAVTAEVAEAAAAFLKRAAGLKSDEKRKPQHGKIKVRRDGANHTLAVRTAGSTAGEAMSIEVDPDDKFKQTVGDLGFLPGQLDLVNRAAADKKGIVLVCAPDGQGLTTLIYALLRNHDAFLQHIQTVERKPPAELEGITQNRLETREPAEASDKLRWITSQEPDVVMVSDAPDAAAAEELLRFAATGKMVYVGLRAASTFDALGQWERIVGNSKKALADVRLVVAGRVVRRLCNACKIEYRPDPSALKKMNLDPDRITSLFEARTEPLRDEKGNEVICEFCHGLGFNGRFGVFEVLDVTDDVRAAAGGLAQGSGGQMKGVFRKQRGKYLQEAALKRVEEGDTGVQEVLRVMKATAEPKAAKKAPSSKPKPAKERASA